MSRVPGDLTREEVELIAKYQGDILEDADAPPPSPPDPDKASDYEGWWPALNPTQRKIFDDPAKNILGHGEKGCRTGDTMIYTQSGLKRLASLKPDGAKPGEFAPINVPVISFAEYCCHATADGFWTEPGDEALRAQLANGSEITGSPRHPMWTCWQNTQTGEHDFGYKTLAEMKAGKVAGFRYWTPMVRHFQWADNRVFVLGGKEITTRLAYAIGALVGDGSLNVFTGDHRSVGFTNQDPECLAEVCAGMVEIGCRLFPVNDGNGFNYTVRGKLIKPLIKELGIGHLSYFKRIPDQIIESSPAVAAAFLSGLFDTDGTVEKSGVVSLCTVSENLSRDAQDLLACMGILCVRRPRKSASGRPTWTLSIMGSHAWEFGQKVGFRITRKQDRIRPGKVSALNPNGFNHNFYGYPDPIRSVMKGVAIASRSNIRKHHDGKIHRNRQWHDDHRHLHSFGSVPSPQKVRQFCAIYECSDKLTRFFVSDNWLEIESVQECKAQLYDLHVPITHSFLASGTINHNSGKTIAFGHKGVRHCYENNDALWVIISPMMSSGSEGIWHDLESLILPAWRDGNRHPPYNPDGTPNPLDDQLMDEGIGLEYTESRLDPLTKDRIRWIRNKHGGWSKIMLKSIPSSSQVEKRVKGPAPSFIYVDELTECDGRNYWKFVAAQLGRRRGVTGPMQFTASCNAKGPSHWVYQVFFVEYVDPETKKLDHNFSVYHVPITENEHRLPAGYVDNLRTLFKNDPTEWARLIEGEWIDMPTGDGIFRSYYSPNLHLKGDAIQGTGLQPVRGFPITIGYDIGQVWQGVTFLQCIPTATKNIWIVFDECDHLKERILYKMLALEIIQRMRYWRREIGYRFTYQHVTDESALNQWRPGGEGGYDAWEFEKEFNVVLTEFGKIGTDGNVEPARMMGCPKGPGSVAARVRLVQAKLAQEELFVSATCKNTLDCLNNLECDKTDPTKPARSRWLHKFDSFSYPLFKMEIGGDPRFLLPLARQSEAPRIIQMGSR